MNMWRVIPLLLFSMLLASCSSLKVVQKPITWNQERDDLTIRYMQDHYDMAQEKPTITPKMVVVHWTAIPSLEGSFRAFDPVNLPGAREDIAEASKLNVSVQYLVDRDGTVYQLMPETKMARHVIGLNHCAIGIENVGDGEKAPLTLAQKQANIKLIKDIAKRHEIDYVIGHHEYKNFIGHTLWKETDPNYLTDKVDPGDEYMDDIRAQLTELQIKEIPSRVEPITDEEEELHARLYNNYENYKEDKITHRRFKHDDIVPLIKKVALHKDFKLQRVGASIEGKAIYLLSYGNGKIPVYLWSQMHGNEATATMALMDIFNFLTSEDEKEYRDYIRQNLTLHFIPLLNPDGADNFVRYNANDVDLNRDALRLVNPEAKILKRIRDSLDAQWGFNLHDQNVYYAAGLNPYPASFSFLAPPYNYAKDINEVRGNAMKMIGKLNALLQEYIPHQVGKYNDAFEPRAFGDNIQKWGTSTILIESGGLQNDREKQQLRKLHFVILLTAFHAIASGSYEALPLKLYDDIPFNDSNGFHELILRKANVKRGEKTYTLDLAFRQSEINNDNEKLGYHLQGRISDVGDLSVVHGYQEFDASAYDLTIGKVYNKEIKSMEAFSALNNYELYSQGFTTVYFPSYTDKVPARKGLLIINEKLEQQPTIRRGQNPPLVLSKNGKVAYVVINGTLIKAE